jgi:hypothetical protein
VLEDFGEAGAESAPARRRIEDLEFTGECPAGEAHGTPVITEDSARPIGDRKRDDSARSILRTVCDHAKFAAAGAFRFSDALRAGDERYHGDEDGRTEKLHRGLNRVVEGMPRNQLNPRRMVRKSEASGNGLHPSA